MQRFIAPALLAVSLLAAPVAAHASEDENAELIAKGEKVFKKCKACHQVGEGAKNVVGPVLNGVIGRTAGTAADYKYSKAMIAAGEGGMVWNEDNLKGYLENPKKFIAKNKMSFVGLRKEKDRDAVIAYLEQFSAQ